MTAQCKHEKIKTNVVVDNAGDVEQTVCASEECGFVINEVVLVERPDGTILKRPRSVSKDAQPENIQFEFSKDGSKQVAEEGLVSARDMMALAVKTREETVGKQSRELAKVILGECAKNVLVGEYSHLIKEGEDIPGEIVALAAKELRSLGYKVKKTPEPGAGTWINVKWPTTNRKPRKKKGAKEEELEIKIGKRRPRKKPKGDLETQKKQRSAAEHRKKALKSRSNLPS